MQSKIVFLAATLAVAAARPQAGHGHGHAYSSQSIVLHSSSHDQRPLQLAQEHQPALLAHQPLHLEKHEKQQDDHHEHQVDYYAIPKYTYEYKVEDPHTHDSKYQHETRDHDVVKGVYSLHQPDGRIRIVHYTADKKNGFQAEVKYEGEAKHIEPESHSQH